MRSDDEIKQAVQAQLDWGPLIAAEGRNDGAR